jgi:hypothetical protein
VSAGVDLQRLEPILGVSFASSAHPVVPERGADRVVSEQLFEALRVSTGMPASAWRWARLSILDLEDSLLCKGFADCRVWGMWATFQWWIRYWSWHWSPGRLPDEPGLVCSGHSLCFLPNAEFCH